MLQFLEKNYFWIIIVIIVILMTIIGYVAERTDFGHRKVDKVVNKKKEKAEKDRQDRESLKNSSLKINDIVYKDKDKDKDKDNSNTPLEERPVAEVNPLDDVPEELKAPLGDTPKEEKEVNLNVPIGDAIKSAQKNFVNGITETLPGVEEDLNAPLPEMKKNDTPTIEESTSTSDVAEDENIWKF